METWNLLIDVLVLLAAALLLGTLAERYKQSAIVGYLTAGAIVGPHALRLVRAPGSVESIAELGIALLLFTIGLEFSFRRLRQLGRTGLMGGALQVLLTGVLVAVIAAATGVKMRGAVIVGCMIALSSTATVLRLLAERIEVESPHGRFSLAILLFQDVAVVPLALLASALSSGGSPLQMTWMMARTVLAGAGMFAAFYLLFNVLAPKLLNLRQWTANRELPILLAIIIAIGSAAAAHALGISPSIGAFFAGVLLAESPFAAQIRADVASLKTLFVTLFFASVGMLADLPWVATHWHIVSAVVAGTLLLKVFVAWGIMRGLGVSPGLSLATGLCLAQVGEFAFVLSQIARGTLIDEPLLRLLAASAVVTLFLTPYLVRLAGAAAHWVDARSAPRADQTPAKKPDGDPDAQRIVIVGFGPAGQRVAESLMGHHRDKLMVIDLNPRMVAVAERYGLRGHVGNAWQPEILHEAGIAQAALIVITIPDPGNSRQVIDLCRTANPEAKVLVRSRYHAARWELEMAGASVVVDEEELIGLRLAAEARRALGREE